MYALSGKVLLLVCFPVTRELHVEVDDMQMTLQWLQYRETLWRVTLREKDFADYLLSRLSHQEIYQQELFHSGASSHRWIWFYEEKIPVQVRSLECNTEFIQRCSTLLVPEDSDQAAVDVYLNEKLKKLEGQFMHALPINVFTGTWNCAGEAPRESVVEWLRGRGEGEPDIVILGLQEVCQLTPTNMLGDPERVREWEFFLDNEVRRAFTVRYRMIVQKDLVGLVLVVFVSDNYYAEVNHIQASAIKLGFRGYVGNKGALVARFDVCDSSFCAVNCHFEAHAGDL
jgi:hypothetical protein